MSDARVQPPWDFFHDASIASLQSFELSRLNNAANLRRQIAALLDQWVNDNSQALLARWVREQRDLLRAANATSEVVNIPRQSVLPFDPSTAPALLPRRQERLQKLARSQQR